MLVPDEYLTTGGPSPASRRGRSSTGDSERGLGRTFDLDQEIFSPLSMAPGERERPITNVQFDIRATEHLATAMQLVKEIADMSGY